MRKIYKNFVRLTLGILALGLSFSTYGQITTYPFTEGFEGGAIPSGWTQEYVSGTADWNIVSTNGSGNVTPKTGSEMAEFRTTSTGNATKLVTPQLDITVLTSAELNFYFANENWVGDIDELRVYYKAAIGDAWTQLGPSYTNENASWTEVTLTLPNASGDYYIAFEGTSNWARGLNLDDITIGEAPSCLKPTSLVTTAISSTTADVGWTPGGSESEWSVSWGTPGYTPGDANEIGNDNNVPTNSYNIPSLTAETHYDVYVRAICGPGDTSAWIGPLDVFTGYCEVSTTNTSDYLYSLTSSGAVTDVSYVATSQPAGSYANETGQTFESYEGQTFDINTAYQGGSNGVNIWIDWDNNLQFEASELVASLANSDASKTLQVTVPPGTSLGDYRVRIRGQLGSSANPPACGNVNYGSTIDFNLTIVAPPSCIEPSALLVSAMTGQTADVGWTPGGSESQWSVSWGTPGYTPGDANEIGNDNNVSTNPYQISGLTAETDYDIYVRAICGPGDTSAWTGPLDIFTGYCGVSTTSGDYLTSIVSSGALTDISYTASSQPSGGYANETAQTFESYEGQTFDINTEYSYTFGSNGVNVWIDWGNDLSFDASDLVDYNLTSGGSNSLTITIPTGTPVGDYRMRVRGMDGSSANPGACGEESFGSTVDFNLTIVAAPTCLSPEDLLVAPVYSDSASVSWTPMSGETSWIVAWGPPGFTPGDANELGNSPSSNPFYTITGLTGSSSYDVYVRADCGGGDSSYWAGPVSFDNYYCTPPANTSSYSLEDVQTTGALTNLNNVGSGFSTGGYGDFTATDTLVVYPGQVVDFSLQGSSTSMRYYVWVDFFQNMNFTDAGEELYATSSSSYENGANFQFTVPSVPEMTTRLRVRSTWSGVLDPCNSTSSSETEDYIIKIVAAPSCLPPINLDSLDATTTSIQVGWDEQNTATNWNIEYGPTGFTPGTGTVVAANSNPFTVPGLNPSSTYDFYVQSDCGGGDESFWGGPMTASTVCGVASAPFYEGFNTGTQPICWSNVSSNTTSTSINNFWKFSGTVESGAASNGKPGGTYAISDGDFPNPDSMMLITPEIDLSTLTTPALSFEWFSNNTSYPGDNVLLIVAVTTDNINWITLDTLKGDDPEWQFASYDLSAFANDTIRAIFRTNQTVTINSTYLNDILLDEVRIDDCVNGQSGSKDVCRLDGTVNLNDNIIVPPNGGGKWYGGTALSGLITNDSILDVTSLPAGSYDVYYSERTVCYDTTVATITVYGPSSAGNGTTIHACKYAPLNLFSALDGNVDMGGDWYDFNGDLLPNSQPTSPGIQASYNYRYITSNGVCPADTATVEVVIDDCIWVDLEEEAFTDISVYPNPATHQINITNPSNASDLKVKVLDVNGRVVLVDNDVMKNTTKATIAIDQLAKGIYTLRVYNNEGQKVFKVVKQ